MLASVMFGGIVHQELYPPGVTAFLCYHRISFPAGGSCKYYLPVRAPCCNGHIVLLGESRKKGNVGPRTVTFLCFENTPDIRIAFQYARPSSLQIQVDGTFRKTDLQRANQGGRQQDVTNSPVTDDQYAVSMIICF